MDKNRVLALLIIVFIILAGIFYAIWFVFFNKGQVIVSGVPPFTVAFEDETYTCLDQQCLYELTARMYSYVIKKDGYEDQTGYINILRGKTVFISHDATFEAKVLTGVDYPMLSLPAGYSKFKEKLLDISLFHLIPDGYSLKKMPKKIDDIFFSSSGKSVVLFNNGLVSYYKTDDFTSTDLDVLSGASAVAWNQREDAVYSIAYDEASKKDALLKINLDDKSVERDVYFPRNIDKYALSVSPDENFVALIDKTSSTQILYLIDRVKKTRKNIFEGHAIDGGIWSKNNRYYIFEGKQLTQDMPSLWILDTQNLSVNKLLFNTSLRLISGAQDGKFYFVTTQKYSLSGLTKPYVSVFDAFEDTISDLTDTSLVSLHVYNADENQSYLILELTGIIPSIPQKIEVNDSGAIVRMLIDKKYFDVKVAE